DPYSIGRSFGHLAFQVEDIYQKCEELQNKGVTILRPPRDGYMAFIKSPDGISVELLQKGQPKPEKEPWKSQPSVGSW
ncbi:MAG: VOC family protein, partial [Bdellovibrionota bacterium]|nr:VOC family protein [Bdellovibrionota bacterium]